MRLLPMLALVLGLVLALALPATGAAARGAAAEGIGITRAVRIAEERVPGRVVEAELEMDGPHATYEVEVVRDRQLHQVVIDARTGAVRAARVRTWRSLWGRWTGSDRFAAVRPPKRLSEILAGLERATNGRVREVSLETERGMAWYEVEIATRAGVTTVNLDPSSGERLAMVYDD